MFKWGPAGTRGLPLFFCGGIMEMAWEEKDGA